MKRISDIDSNFRVNTELKGWVIFLRHREGSFLRLWNFKKTANTDASRESCQKYCEIYHLHRIQPEVVRFRTNSRRIAIIARMDHLGKMPHFAFSGSCGLDLYAREKNEDIYCGTFMPNLDIANGYESIMELPDDKTKDITINFPLYSDIIDLYIGIDSHAALGKAESYRRSKPIVFYGSSITQGNCASRPGNSYQSILSRQLNCDYINLGFSGAARRRQSQTILRIWICPFLSWIMTTMLRVWNILKRLMEKCFKKYGRKERPAYLNPVKAEILSRR